MAKVFGKVIKRDIAALRGKVDLYYHKHIGWIARAWPRYNNKNRSQAYEFMKARMREQTAVLAPLTTESINLWRKTVQGSDLTWKDFIMKRVLLRSTDEFIIFYDVAPEVIKLSPTTIEIRINKNPEDVGTERDSFVMFRANVTKPIRQTIHFQNFPGDLFIVFRIVIPPDADTLEFIVFGNNRIK